MKCNTYILKSKISRVFKTVIYILECLTDSFWEMNRKVRILYIQKNGRIKKNYDKMSSNVSSLRPRNSISIFQSHLWTCWCSFFYVLCMYVSVSPSVGIILENLGHCIHLFIQQIFVCPLCVSCSARQQKTQKTENSNRKLIKDE